MPLLLLFTFLMAGSSQLTAQSILPTVTAAYGKTTKEMISGDVVNVNPMPNCENVTIEISAENLDKSPQTLVFEVQLSNEWLNPAGANTGWTLVTPANAPFIRYEASVAVSGGATATAPPFKFLLLVPGIPESFRVRVGVGSLANSFEYFGNAYLNAAQTLSGNSSALALPTCSSSVSDPNFYIADNLTIDNNFCFQNNNSDPVFRPRFFVAAGKAITVQNGGTLNITTADIAGCLDTWTGIVVQNGGRVVADDAEIRDAATAITVERGGRLGIQNSRVINNNIGIALNGSAGSGAAPLLENCTNNIFGWHKVNGEYVKSFGEIPERTQAGILANAAAPVVLLNNTFEGQFNRGVSTTGCALNAVGNKFINVGKVDPLPLFRDPIALEYIDGPSLTVSGLGGQQNSTPTFDGIDKIAIRVTGAGVVNINNNRMINTPRGIEIANCPAPLVAVENNRMHVTKYGISTSSNGILNSNSAGIKGNVIVVDGDATESAAIQFNEVHSFSLKPKASIWKAENNQIVMDYARYGIRALSGKGYYFSNNTVNIANATQADAEGIHLGGVLNSAVNCNAVYLNNGGNTGVYPGSTKGYYSASGAVNDFACNSSENSYYGFNFLDMAQDITVKGNTAGNHWIGLSLGQPNVTNASIGIQGSVFAGNGNNWELDYFANDGSSRLGAKHWSPSPTAWNNSRFHAPRTATCPDFYPKLEPAQLFWFPWYSGCSVAFTCTGGCPPAVPDAPRNSDIDDFDLYIASGGPANDEYLPALTGKLEMNLYRRLQDEPALQQQNALLTTFVSNHGNGLIGQLYDIEKEIALALQVSVADSSDIALQSANLKTALDQVQTLNVLAAAGQPFNAVQRQQALDNATAAQAALGVRAQALDTQRAAAWSNLLSRNDAISTNLNWAEHQRFANRIALLRLSGTEPGTDELDQLNALANSCPITEGDAVYMARSLNAAYHPTAAYDDALLCADSEQRQVAAGAAAGALRAMPNPGTGLFRIEGLQSPDARYEVFGTDGRLLASGAFHTNTVDLSRLGAGLYLMRVQDNGSSQTLRLNIVR